EPAGGSVDALSRQRCRIKKSRRKAGFFYPERAPLRSKLPQDVMQDAAVLHVLDFLWRVEPHTRGEFLLPAAVPGGNDLDGLRLAVVEPLDVEGFRAIESELGRTFTVHELQRYDAHTDQVGAVNALVALCDYRANTEQQGAFRSPVAGRASAVFLAGDHHQRRAFRLVF